MLICDLTFPRAAENLACDEALLEECEGSGAELLRFWEPGEHFVVVGYANKVETEVNVAFCRASGIPILRRCTGGGTVLQGPGCLNYSLVLRVGNSGPLSTIPGTNAYILERHCRALSATLSRQIVREGQTDLVVDGLKISGNAQRRRKDYLLFHGTFLLRLELALVEKALPMPSRQPEYRRNRSHGGFLTNLQVPGELVKRALADAWGVTGKLAESPAHRVNELAAAKYETPEWNFKF